MKKFLAILLAMMLIMVSVSALATGDVNQPTGDPQTEDEGGDEGGSTGNTQVVSVDPSTASGAAGNPTKPVQVEITKSIANTEDDVYQQADRHPEVTLTFTAEVTSVELSTETVDTAPAVTFEQLTIGENADNGQLKINLPSYKAVGIYTYTVTEAATGYAGMHEAANLELKVTVIQNVENGNLEIAGIAVRQDDVKTDDIENVYKSGRIMVTKLVDGKMGDRTKEFPITITLTAPEGKTVASTVTYKVNGGSATTVTFNDEGEAEVKVNLKHEDSVEIFNIPEGVTYTIVEDDDIEHVDNPTDEQENANAYKVEGEIKEDTEIEVAARTSYEITNTKDIDVDTGITLETLPYVLLMALAVMGFVALKLRRREEY